MATQAAGVRGSTAATAAVAAAGDGGSGAMNHTGSAAALGSLVGETPSGDMLRVREVWQDNLEEEMALIRTIVDDFPFLVGAGRRRWPRGGVCIQASRRWTARHAHPCAPPPCPKAMDTEFPGVVARPVGNFKNSGEYHYQTLRWGAGPWEEGGWGRSSQSPPQLCCPDPLTSPPPPSPPPPQYTPMPMPAYPHTFTHPHPHTQPQRRHAEANPAGTYLHRRKGARPPLPAGSPPSLPPTTTTHPPTMNPVAGRAAAH